MTPYLLIKKNIFIANVLNQDANYNQVGICNIELAGQIYMKTLRFFSCRVLSLKIKGAAQKVVHIQTPALNYLMRRYYSL